ncbi:hypothetical protein AXG89_33345 (plasmid) [Burkholderia sp. PAMC 26561]|nr:hypothetical protein AXG89_33345 [Burkholderia sp. PAMC 26561]
MRPALAQVQYSYDPNGRLVKVTMPNGAFATYTYDPDGNILSISNSAASAVSITAMTPQSGPVGSTVTLQGSGFDPVAANDTVQFNGTSATVTSASATSLQATVPPGASSGTVSVTNSHGTAVAPTAFNVVAAGTIPTITKFSPAAAAVGGAVTITGTGFNPSMAGDTVSFGNITTNINSATASSIVANVPTQSSSGKITVATSGGTAVSSTDFYAVPNAFTPANITTKIRVQPAAAAQTVSLAGYSKAALMIFDATAGQKLYFTGTSNTFSNATLTVYSPTGSVVTNTLTASTTNFSADRLPVTGTYTAALNGNSSGHIKYQLLQGPTDISGTLPTDGSTINFSLPIDGGATYSFNGNAGQMFDIQTTNTNSSTAGLPRLFVQDPEGNVVADEGESWSGTSILHIPALPSSGTYSLRLSPVDLGTSSGTIQLISVVPPATGTFAIDGAPLTIQFSQYQSGTFTFSGTAGQRLYFMPTNSSFDTGLQVVVTAPDQSETLRTMLNAFEPEADDLAVLPVNGTYSVAITTPDDSAGAMTVALKTKPTDQAITATVNGTASQLSLAFDQDGQVTFTGTKNQALWIQPTAYSYASCAIAELYDSTNTSLGSTAFCDTSSSKNDFSGNPLAASSTYHLHVSRNGDPSAGSSTFAITTVPADKTGTLTVNGAAVTATLGVHQSGHYTFAANAGDVVTIATSGQTLDPSTFIHLLGPDGSEVDEWFPNSPSDSHTLAALPTTGTYVLEIVPNTTAAGKITIKATK